MPGNTLFSYSSLVHAVSGGCGSAVAMSTFFPLDTVRTRLQLETSNDKDVTSQQKKYASVATMLQHIAKVEGHAGLYRGLVPVLQSLYCSNFVYFYAFHTLKASVNQNGSAFNDLLFGMTAGVINVMSTTPLWVVNTRIKMQGSSLKQHNTQEYTGLIDGLCRIYQQDGVRGLWAGCGSSLILVINPAIQFMAYEAIKRRLIERSGGAAPNSLLVFLAGAVAKAVATTLTYPIQLAQARQRHGASKLGLLQLLAAVLREDGPKGLFRGLNAKLLQTVLTAALMFLCYEKIAAVVFAVLMGQRKMAMHRM